MSAGTLYLTLTFKTLLMQEVQMGHQAGPCCHTEAAASDHSHVTGGQKLGAKESVWESGFLTAEEQPRIHHCSTPFQALQHSQCKLRGLKWAAQASVCRQRSPSPLPVQVFVIRHEAMGLSIVNSDITACAIHLHKTQLIRLMTIMTKQHRSAWKCTALLSPTYTSRRIRSNSQSQGWPEIRDLPS